MPKQFRKVESDLIATSRPTQILRANFSADFLKENLPSQTGYLTLQMSEDYSYLYIGYCQITKERKVQYYVNKMSLAPAQRDLLKSLVN